MKTGTFILAHIYIISIINSKTLIKKADATSEKTACRPFRYFQFIKVTEWSNFYAEITKQHLRF